MAAISADTLIQAGSLVFAVVTFLSAHIITKIKDRNTAKWHNYQQLELASIDLFRFEADHLEIVGALWEKGTPRPAADSAKGIVLMNYVCQHLNLFEMAVRFRKEHIIPHEVFGSWVVWMLNLSQAPGFPAIWEDVMCDYTQDLRDIFKEARKLNRSEQDEAKRKAMFFEIIGQQLDCEIIRHWSTKIDHEKQSENSGSRPATKSQITHVPCHWADQPNPESIAAFMTANMTFEYISHGELLDGRAIDLYHWNPNLASVLTRELEKVQPIQSPQSERLVLAEARLDNELVAIALVSLVESEISRDAILLDLIVAEKHRDHGVGRALLTWVENELKARSISRIFLESGKSNDNAHRFFHNSGYATCSVTMFKSLVNA